MFGVLGALVGVFIVFALMGWTDPTSAGWRLMVPVVLVNLVVAARVVLTASRQTTVHGRLAWSLVAVALVVTVIGASRIMVVDASNPGAGPSDTFASIAYSLYMPAIVAALFYFRAPVSTVSGSICISASCQTRSKTSSASSGLNPNASA